MSNYDLVCQLEEIAVQKRFLPYSIGTSSQDISYNDSYERANFIFFSDSHVDLFNAEESLDNVKRTIDFSNHSPVKFDAVLHAGDIITPLHRESKEIAFTRAASFFEAVKPSRSAVLFAKGNHDLNDWYNTPEQVLTDDDFAKLFYDYAEENYGIIRQKRANGSISTWNYYDIEDKKIRIISLDVQDVEKTTTNEDGTVKYFGGNSFYISNEQMSWIADVAFNFDEKEEKDWGVILVFHQYPPESEEYENAVDKLLDLCVAFNNAGVYENKYVCQANSFFNLDISADFTRYQTLEKKPHIICWLLGHIHQDTHETRKGIHIITILNSSATNKASDARIARILGTPTQNAFDILNIDTRERKIRLFRYGAGTDCFGIGGDRFLPDGLTY